MQAEPNDGNARSRIVMLRDFVIELGGPARLSAAEVTAQFHLVEAELDRLASTLRSMGPLLTTDVD